MSKLFTTLTLVAAVALSACSTTNPDVVKRGDAQRMSQLQDATVLSSRPVPVDGSQSGVGAVAGAVIGNAIERASTQEDALEIIVQLRNGERRSIVQAKGNETFNSGDPVVLVTTGGKTRVTRAPAVAPAPAATDKS